MTTKKINIPIKVDHIARIEGKAGIDVFIENKELIEVQVNIFEGPRFFEAITVGKPVDEATAIFPRVCSFCAAAHKVTALQAAEIALGMKPSKQTTMLRDLMYLGDQIESHALHLYLLALPDFLGYPDAFSMAKEYPDAVKTALQLKDIGAKIQVTLGSRFMHQENAILGGFGKLPTQDALKNIKSTLFNLRQQAEQPLELFLDHELWEEVTSKRTHLALVPDNKKYGILGQAIKASDGTEFPATDYKEHIKEKVVEHSFAKHSLFKKKPFMTGALSRFALHQDLLYGRAKELTEQHKSAIDINNPLANNLAQALELVYFVERSYDLIDEILSKYNEDEKRKKIKYGKAGLGVSVSEAPRGMLAYTIEVDEKGLVKATDIITPTAMFLPLMESDLEKETKYQLENKVTDPKIITQKLETIVRSYDPCVSCSVHVTEVKK